MALPANPIARRLFYTVLGTDGYVPNNDYVTAGAESTTALLLGSGTNTSPVSTATANMNFFDFRTKTTATSGTTRGLYLKTYHGDTTPSGETARFYSVVDAAGATDVHGIHASVAFGATGTCVGEVAAIRATFQVPDAALGGTNAALYSELYADGKTSSISGNISFMRAVLAGDGTGLAAVEDSAALFSIEGGTINTGNLVAAKSSAAVSHVIRIRVNGTPYYLMVSDAV